jgi:hypothetical protein
VNVWKIAMFVFLAQLGFTLVSVANIPISCDASYTQCAYFDAGTMSSTDMGSVISGQIDSGNFRSTQIQENIFTDAFAFTSMAFSVITSFIYMSIAGIFTVITFAFGKGVVSLAFASGMQVVVYFFYGRLIVDVLKPGSRGEA